MKFLNLTEKSFSWLFAELAVVVVGILLAFQFDEWRADFIQRQEEVVLLNGLRDEFSTNIESLNQGQISLQEQQKTLLNFLYSKPEEFEPEVPSEKMSALITAMHRTYTNRGVTHGYLNSTTSTGNLTKISSDAIRAALLEIEDYERETELLAGDLRDLTDLLIVEIGKYADTTTPFWDESKSWAIISSSTNATTLAEMRTNTNLTSVVAAKSQRIGPFVGVRQSLIDHLQKIVLLIDEELS